MKPSNARTSPPKPKESFAKIFKKVKLVSTLFPVAAFFSFASISKADDDKHSETIVKLYFPGFFWRKGEKIQTISELLGINPILITEISRLY